MKVKHTKTPFNIAADGCIYGDEGRQLVAKVSDSTHVTDPEELANGELIVQACNCHDKLVTACKFAKAQIKKGAGKKALPFLRAALVDAKEKPCPFNTKL